MRAWISSKERSGMAGWLWGGRWLGWMACADKCSRLDLPREKWIWADRLWEPQAARLEGSEDDRWYKGFKGLEVPWSAVYTEVYHGRLTSLSEEMRGPKSGNQSDCKDVKSLFHMVR
jgi:hypothetical protein